jgi:hypothetical protein
MVKSPEKKKEKLNFKSNINNPNNPKFKEEYEQRLLWDEKKKAKKEAYLARRDEMKSNRVILPRYGNKMAWYIAKLQPTPKPSLENLSQ